MTKNAEPCHAFRHMDGDKHACHRDDGHRGEHHADSGLRWSSNPHARRTRMADDPAPTANAAERYQSRQGAL
jgi:hypothetical protein